MEETIDDLTVVWMGAGTELAKRMLALADDLDAFGSSHAADLIRDVVRCDYNPLPDQLPQLRHPPTLRPAVPMKPEVGS